MKILFVEENKKHIILNILGIKIKLKKNCSTNKIAIKKFIEHNIAPNTILLIEINDHHQETLMGYYKYLNELNYNVEIITNSLADNPFYNNYNNLKVWYFSKDEILKLFVYYNFDKYKRIIFNSKLIYGKKGTSTDIFNFLSKVPKGQKENIYVQHHIDKINDDNSKQIILANPAHNKDLSKLVVNPHYFGEVAITPKSNLTTFISIGELNPIRRNSSVLIDALQKLVDKGIVNFKVTIVGSGKLKNLPKIIRPYINIKGRLSFQDMYKELENADFFLPLLDPDITSHKRYMDSGTSGSFQLIYGFLKPCIIHKTFADIYNFNNDNSIVYEKNSEFSHKLEQAINLSNRDYLYLQNNLKEAVKKIHNISIANFEEILQ